MLATLAFPQIVQAQRQAMADAQAQEQIRSQPQSVAQANSPTHSQTNSQTKSGAQASLLSQLESESKNASAPGNNLVFILRHAIAPGTGDPAGFRIGDCSTQRNLSQEGMRQAQEIGKRLKALRMTPSSIWSSEWCRAIETAKNLGLGPAIPLPALNSFFAMPEKGPSQMQELQRFLARLDPTKGPYVMVTHQVVVTTLTGVFPGSGEGVWLKLTGDKAKPWVIQPMAGF
jgi:phosphohistidine phosphatase SixA